MDSVAREFHEAKHPTPEQASDRFPEGDAKWERWWRSQYPAQDPGDLARAVAAADRAVDEYDRGVA